MTYIGELGHEKFYPPSNPQRENSVKVSRGAQDGLLMLRANARTMVRQVVVVEEGRESKD